MTKKAIKDDDTKDEFVETIVSLLERFSKLEGTLQTQRSCLIVELGNSVRLNSARFVQTII